MVTALFDTVLSIIELRRLKGRGVFGSLGSFGSFGSFTSLIATIDVRRDGAFSTVEARRDCGNLIDNGGSGAFLLKIKAQAPQQKNRMQNPKIAERPIAAFSPSPIGALMYTIVTFIEGETDPDNVDVSVG